MKLIFSKDENEEITLQLQKGTVAEDFTYVEMVKQLLEDKAFEDTEFSDLSDDEKQRVEAMLEKIEAIFKEEDDAEG